MPKSWNDESDEEKGDNHDNFLINNSEDIKAIANQSKSRSSSVGNNKPSFNSKSRTNNQNPEPCNCIGIFGLARETDEKTLWEIFEKFGTINSVKLIMDKFQNTSLGFAFINYAELDSATTAIKEANGIELDGKKIRVDYSITKKAHTPTPGGYKGKLTNRRNFGNNDNFSTRRGGKRNFNERSRSRSPKRNYYPTKTFDRNYSPEHNERISRSTYGHEKSRYSPRRTEYSRYSPRRVDQGRYSPRRSDPSRFSPPRRHEYSRYSPRKVEPSRYSPRRQEPSKYISSRRPESGRYSPPRRAEPSRYSPPRRTEPSRYSPQRRAEPSRYSPMRRTGASRYSPPRRDVPVRYESTKAELIRYDQHRYSPRTEKSRYPAANQWDRKRSSPPKDDFIPYSINGNINKSISNEAKRYGGISQFNGKHSPDDSFNRKCYPVDNYFSNSRNN